MIFKILIDSDYEKAKRSANTIRNYYGIKITDERIVPIKDAYGNHVMDTRLFICEGTQYQLDKICEDCGLEFRQEYEGAPLYG